MHQLSIIALLLISPVVIAKNNNSKNDVVTTKAISTSKTISQYFDAQNGDTLVITAVRQASPHFLLAESIDVIGRETMDKHQTDNFSALTRYLPSVSANQETSNIDPFGNVTGFTIRGVSNNRILMQVDGNRIIESITDGNRSFVDLSTVKAVEIIRGPSSVLWGADALGGVVSFKTLDPVDLLKEEKTFASKVNLNYNSLNNQLSQTGIIAFKDNKSIQGLFATTLRQYDEAKYRKARADGGIWGCPRPTEAIDCSKLNPLDAQTYSLLGKIVWTPNDQHEIKFTTEYYRNESDIHQRYDYGTQANGSFNGRYLRNQKQTRTRFSIEDIWQPQSTWLDELKWQLSYSPQQRVTTGTRKQINTKEETVKTNTQTHYKEHFLQADIQLLSSFSLANTEHELLYGFQGDTTKTDYNNVSRSYNLTSHAESEKYAGGFNFANAKTIRADFYLQDEIRLFDQRLTLTPGIRLANYQITPKPDNHYHTITDKAPKKIDSTRLIPQIGTTYQLTDHTLVYGRYAEGFKMPTAQQLFTSVDMGTASIIPNPDLNAERVKSYELGIRGKYNTVQYSMGLFNANYSDYIRSLVAIGPGLYSYMNMDKVTLSGIETSFSWRFTPQWQFNSSLAYQYGTQKVSAANKKVPYDASQPLSGTAGIQWNNPSDTVEVEFVSLLAKGVTRTSAADIYKPAGYAVFDTYLRWKPSTTVTFGFSVKNLFDRRYFSGPLSSDYTLNPNDYMKSSSPLELKTAPGRTFTLDFTATF